MKDSALGRRITREQRERLVGDAQAMVEQYRAEMEAHFWPKRREWERQANDDFKSRLTSDPNAPQRIFDLSNESLNIVRNVTRFMIARTSEDIFGSKPYVAVDAIGTMDGPLAEQMNRHVPWKLDQARYSAIGKEAIGLALNLGECVQKATHRTDLDRFEKLDIVLCDKKTGKPVIHGLTDAGGAPLINEDGDEEGEYIYPEDATITAPGGGPEVYATAPEVPVDGATEFREVLVEETVVKYHGPDVANVRFDAFIAPLNVATLEDADCVCHEFTQTVSQLRAKYGPKPGEEADEELAWLFEQLEQEPEGPKTAEDKPRTTFGEVSQGRATVERNPPVKVQEHYLRDYDVFEDGVGRNVFLVLVADHPEPLYLEYLGIVVPKGRKPFQCIPVNRVPGRWYGRGFYELYHHDQELIDALINAILWRNENNADPLICWQPDATEDGRTERRLLRRPGKTITLRAGKAAKDAVEVVEFPDLDQRTMELVQLIMQLIQTDSGVTSAAQGDYSALPSASTATGVSSILQSASTLHRMLTEDLKDGFEPALLLAVELIYAHQDRDEIFRFLEGHDAEVLSLASARALSQLTLKVRLLLDRFQMREQREQAQLVITQVLPAWINALQVSGLPTALVAQCAQPLFVQVAKGADIHQPDALFQLPDRPPPTPPPGQPGGLAPDPNGPAALPAGGGPPALPSGGAGSAGSAGSAGDGAAPAPPPPLPVNVLPAPAAPDQDQGSGGQGDGETPDADATSGSDTAGQPLDEPTARRFLHSAGGDNDKARALARAAGHQV